jgi:O-antigen/teichoic acid export membrane protein
MAAVVQRLPRNTLTLIISNGGGALLSFILSVLIGRALGETGLGIYTTALAWVFPLWMIAEFGLETLITREVAANPADSAAYLRVAALARMLIGGGLMFLLILAAPLLATEPQLVQGLRISAPLIVIGPFVSVFSAIFRARQAMWPVALLNVGMLAVQVPLTALVFLNDGGVLAALVVNVATSSGQLIAAWGIYRARFMTRTRHIVSLQMGDVLRRAWPFALAAILSAIQLRMSVVLLEQLAGTAVTGQYAAASRFVEAGRMLPSALFGALFPALSMLNANPAAFQRLFRRAISGLAAYGVLFGVGGMLFAPLLIGLTYGERFTPAVDILRLLAWALLPGILRSSRILYCYAQGRERYVNLVTAVALIVQLILSVVLIQTFGASGAAITLIVTEVFMLVLLWR